MNVIAGRNQSQQPAEKACEAALRAPERSREPDPGFDSLGRRSRSECLRPKALLGEEPVDVVIRDLGEQRVELRRGRELLALDLGGDLLEDRLELRGRAPQ